MQGKNFDPKKCTLTCSTCGHDILHLCPLGCEGHRDADAAELTKAKHECFQKLAAKMCPGTVAGLLAKAFLLPQDRNEIAMWLRKENERDGWK